MALNRGGKELSSGAVLVPAAAVHGRGRQPPVAGDGRRRLRRAACPPRPPRADRDPTRDALETDALAGLAALERLALGDSCGGETGAAPCSSAPKHSRPQPTCFALCFCFLAGDLGGMAASCLLGSGSSKAHGRLRGYGTRGELWQRC